MTMDNKMEKLIWTDKDFDQMGWHDSTIYGFAWEYDRYDFLLDIDYILEWLQPSQQEMSYKFLLAPSTLVFAEVHDLSIDLDVFEGITVQDILRTASNDNKREEWAWIIECNQGEIRFKASGYKQYFRQVPSMEESQKLEWAKRGGISFVRGTSKVTG